MGYWAVGTKLPKVVIGSENNFRNIEPPYWANGTHIPQCNIQAVMAGIYAFIIAMTLNENDLDPDLYYPVRCIQATMHTKNLLTSTSGAMCVMACCGLKSWVGSSEIGTRLMDKQDYSS